MYELSLKLMTIGFFVHHLDTHEILRAKGSSFSILFFMRIKKKKKSERGSSLEDLQGQENPVLIGNFVL